MRAMNERPPLTLRANALRGSRDALAARLTTEEGLAWRPARWAPEGLVVEPGGTPGSWGAFADGSFVVQDEASMLVGRLLEPRPGETIADVCAAPGTKTTHLAELMADRGRVLAFDREPARLAPGFLPPHPEFRPDPPGEFPLPLDPDGTLRCLPHHHGTDGFTAVRFRRSLTRGITAP